MTPKQKAQYLVSKFTYSCRECDNAKQSALTAVNQIIKELTEEISPSVHGFRHQYWDEVKNQIYIL
jgi:hypothetical protein